MHISDNTSVEDEKNTLETTPETEAPVPEKMVRWLSQIIVYNAASK